MPTSNDAPGQSVATWWRRLSPLPGGRALFSMLIGRMAPYTGSIGARALELGPGHARWQMRDRRGLRNHLRSLHAIALANLAEVASGTAMLMALPAGTRGIVTGLTITYLKKARGTVIAECNCRVPEIRGEMPFDVQADVTDAAGDVVARATVTWLLRREP
jgi:acyl-coenzyme A thioesterase PaaI-like protein